MIRKILLILPIFICLSPVSPLAILVDAQEPPRPELVRDPAEAEQLEAVERFYRYAAKTRDRTERIYYMEITIPMYEKFLRDYGKGENAAMARFHLGHALQTLGKIDKARWNYITVVKRHKRGEWVGSAARQLAYMELTEKRYQEAARYFGITASNLTDPGYRHTAMTRQAQALIKIGDDQSALAVFANIAETPKHPHREWGIFMRGYILYGAERFEEARTALRPLIEGVATEAYRSQALFYTGLCAAELGEAEVAETNLRAVLETDHQSPSLPQEERRKIANNKSKAQNALMQMYFRGGDHQEVVRLYRMGDFGAQGSLEAARSMTAGNSFYQLERFEQARSAFRRVDRAVPNTERAFRASFKCLECDYKLRHPGLDARVDVFLELYRKAFRKAPEIQTARFLKAQTLFNKAEIEKSAQAFSLVDGEVLREEFRPEFYHKQGFALAEIGDYNGATRSLTEFITHYADDPRYRDALSIRAEAYEKLGDQASSLRDFTSLLDHPDCSPQQYAFALQRTARIYRDRDQFDLMVAKYRTLLQDVENLPKDTEANANYWIGWGLYKADDHQDALPYLKKASALAPEFYAEPAGRMIVLIHFADADADQMDEALTALLKLRPEKLIPRDMLTWLGTQKFHDGNFQKAAFYIGRAMKPDTPRAVDRGVWRMLAKARNEIRNFDGALIAARIAIKLEKDKRWQADAQLDLARAYLGLQKLPEARQAAETGLALNIQGPHMAGLHLTLGEISLLNQEYEQAYAEAIATIRMAIDDPLVKPRALHLATTVAEHLGSQEESNRYRRELERDFPTWQPPSQATSTEDGKTSSAPESQEQSSPPAQSR